jgi:hypothetical protein
MNSGIQVGAFMTSLFGVFLPRFDEPEMLKNDQNWRIIWLFPVVLEIISLICIPVFFKHLSLKALIQNDSLRDLAVSELRKTYRFSETDAESQKNDAASLVLVIKNQSSKNLGKVPFKDALFSKQHRRTSWNTVALAWCH